MHSVPLDWPTHFTLPLNHRCLTCRGNIGATTGSTIHMLLSMMNLEHQVAQPCLIFFVRAANTHPGTVKR